MTDSNNSQWWLRPHISRRAALRAAILGATIPGALYLAKAADSADAADDNIYIPGAPNFLELGHGWPGKEANAGKITYRQWSDALDIVGAGTTPGYRKVKIWDDLYVQGLLNLRAYIVDPEVPRAWTAFLYAKDVNGQSKPFWKDATGTAQPLVARSVTLVVAASNASPRSKLGADYVCDGTADEVEINAAIDALPAGGGKVLLTEGTFTLGNTIMLGSTGTTLEGLGYGTLIQYDGDSATGGCAIGDQDGTTYLTVTHAVVRNLRIKNTGTTTQAPGVLLGWTDRIPQRITVDHVETENCSIWIWCGDHHRVEHCYVHDITAGIDSGIAVRGTGSEWVHGSIIANNTIESVYEMGIAPGQSDGAIVSNNRIVDAAQSVSSFAIDSYTAVNILIAGNSIESKHGILSEDADAGTIQITNNIIKGTGTAAGDGIRVWRVAMDLPQADRILISGNTVHNTFWGINVADEDKVAIVGNLVHNVGECGIIIGKDAVGGVNPTNVLIEGNTVANWAAAAAGAWAPGISADCANVKVSNNYLDGGNQNNSRGISGLLSPGWITDNVIQNVVNQEVYNVSAGVVCRDNAGYATENSGTAAIPNGNTYVDVTHHLNRTPDIQDISVTPTNNLGTASKFWISSVGASTFRINVNTNPGATAATFAWHAEVL
jgi:hypothetical protein